MTLPGPLELTMNWIPVWKVLILPGLVAKGPGSVNAGNLLKFARISGPGLPGNGAAGTGLVYVASTGSQNSMDLYSKDGLLTGGSQCGNGTTFFCPNFWVARTKGLSGTDATMTETNVISLLWAQSADNVNPSLFVKGASYKVELFYGTNTGAADVTFSKTLLSDMVTATRGVNLPWNTLGPKSLAALDPNNASLNGAQTALPVDWVQNISAQQIGFVLGVANTSDGSYGPSRSVPRGAFSAILNNVTVPAFSVTTASRKLLFNYRMLDTSNKGSEYLYN